MAETLCFVPCCKSKTEYPDRRAASPTLTKSCIPVAWVRLQAARKKMSGCIEEAIRPCAALCQYDGGLYNSTLEFREDITRYVNADHLDLYIISAGYGLVHAMDPIQPYEAQMKGSVATLWREAGLVNIISELIRVSRAQRVFGFFAGASHWSGAHAKYRYFFTEGVKAVVTSGAMISSSACFYRACGRGTRAINGALRRTLLRGLGADFSSRFLAEHTNGWRDGNVLIRCEIIHGSL